VVFDTNVLISALLTPRGTCAQAFQAAIEADAVFLYSAATKAEHQEVVTRPHLQIRLQLFQEMQGYLEQYGEDTLPLAIPPLKDPKDTAFLAVALAGGADYLVTGNLKHFPPSPHHGVKILNPAGFLAALGRGRV
jgi:putative PIN family toxin of toxin-antitoxin system